MKILHAIQSSDPATGGPIEAIQQLAATAPAGYHHSIVCLDPPDAPHLAASPVETVALGPAGFLGYSPRLTPWLRQHASDFQAVVVHGLWRYVSVGCWRALHKIDLPYFVFPHGMLDPWFKQRYPLKHLKKSFFWPWTEYRLLRDAQATLFTCEDERLRASTSFRPYRCTPDVVMLGIRRPPAEADRQREVFRARFPALRDKRILLYLSRIHPKKGCDMLIQAFARVASRHADIHLLMAGPDQGGLVEGLKREAQAAGVADRITWAGMITGDLKWGAYRTASAFILPTHHENFGIVVVEAMACGLPVLISDQVQIWREVTASDAGYVEADDVDGTRRLIERWLATAPSEWAALGRRARDCYEQKFEVSTYGRRFMQVLDKHLAGMPAPC